MLSCCGEEAAMGRAITIRMDLGTPAELRGLAKREKHRRTALRLLGIANALDGMSRAQAARAAGIECQSLCDAVKRFNAVRGSWAVGSRLLRSEGGPHV